MDWRGRSIRRTATASRPRNQTARNVQLPAWRPGEAYRSRRLQHALQKNGGLADLWYMDDGDIMCHPILVPSFLQEFDVANATAGAERNPQKTKVIYNVPRRAEYGQSHHSHRGLHDTLSGCRTATAHRVSALGQSGRHSSNARTHSAMPTPADRICSFAGKTGRQPHQPHPASAWPHDLCKRNGLLKSSSRLGSVLSSACSLALRTV